MTRKRNAPGAGDTGGPYPTEPHLAKGLGNGFQEQETQTAPARKNASEKRIPERFPANGTKAATHGRARGVSQSDKEKKRYSSKPAGNPQHPVPQDRIPDRESPRKHGESRSYHWSELITPHGFSIDGVRLAIEGGWRAVEEPPAGFRRHGDFGPSVWADDFGFRVFPKYSIKSNGLKVLGNRFPKFVHVSLARLYFESNGRCFTNQVELDSAFRLLESTLSEVIENLKFLRVTYCELAFNAPVGIDELGFLGGGHSGFRGLENPGRTLSFESGGELLKGSAKSFVAYNKILEISKVSELRPTAASFNGAGPVSRLEWSIWGNAEVLRRGCGLFWDAQGRPSIDLRTAYHGFRELMAGFKQGGDFLRDFCPESFSELALRADAFNP